MAPGVAVAVLVSAAVLAAVLVRRPGPARGGALAGVLLAGAGGWWLLGGDPDPPGPDPAGPAPAGPTAEAFAPSVACVECHQEQYDSWHRTYHRTMTRDATPETVKGDFSGVVHDYQGLRTRPTRDGDAFHLETVDPGWAAAHARAGVAAGPPRYARFRVDRVVGSHWIQEYLSLAPDGRYVRLPVLYHLRERQWVHSNGAFLAPDSPDFWAQSRGAVWNTSCLYCHNTGPSQNPVRDPRGAVVGFETEVAELGIACGACHGPAAEHVRRHKDPGGPAGGPDDVVHPGRLAVPRRDDICARCHGALVPKPAAWDPHTRRDPFVPGRELARYNHLFRSEAEQAVLAGVRWGAAPDRPEPTDGRFWGDGTPLTTALEYNGMALSACYQGGRGRMSCLTCHAMHGDDPDLMLKPGMRTNDACYQCHPGYRDRLAEHTRHPAGSPGSECVACHMPRQVYSLMATHRSHRIQVPDLAGSVGTGKPHACNLCHLDKSLGWTRAELARWPNGGRDAGVRLSADEEAVAAGVLVLATADARSRVVVAGAFADPAAQRAAGTDWFGPFLTRHLEGERYPAVRYLLHRGLRAAHGDRADPFDHLATPGDRLAQLRALRARFDAAPVRRPLPHLPRTADGLPDLAVLDRLRATRSDPDLTINE
jgi:predicted CXXCH cytochrome family protein